MGFPWSATAVTRLFLTIVAAAACGLGADGVAAHRPWFNEAGSPDRADPYDLEDLDVSQVVYGVLGEPGRVDYYRMTVPADFQADILLTVPAVPACDTFRPVLSITGPGLPVVVGTPSATSSAAPATPDEEAGWLVFRQERWGTFFEPFTGTTYATGPRLIPRLAGGTYLLAVYAPDGRVGAYGLSLGGAEEPGGDPDFGAKIGPIER